MHPRSCKDDQPCAVPPHPDVQHRVVEHFENIQDQITGAPSDRPLGLNDGTIFGPAHYPPNIPNAIISQGAQQQPNVRGAIK